MKSSLIRLTSLFFLLSSISAVAQEQVSEEVDLIIEDKQAQQPASSAEATVEAHNEQPEDAYAYVEEKAREYITEKRRKFTSQGKQVFIHSGTALIRLKPTEAGWADARVLAYTEAQQKAREKLLKQIKDELKHRSQEDLLELCLRLARFKKENKDD